MGGLCVAVRKEGEELAPTRASGGRRPVPVKADAELLGLTIGTKVVPESELTRRRGGLVLARVGVEVAEEAPEPATGGRLTILPLGRGDTVEDGEERSTVDLTR